MTLEGLLLQDFAFSLSSPPHGQAQTGSCAVSFPGLAVGWGAQTPRVGGGPGALGQVRMIRSRRSGCSPTTKNARWPGVTTAQRPGHRRRVLGRTPSK